jgi:hypothetical protein
VFLQRAFQSALVELSLPPEGVVTVRDGPVPPALERWGEVLAGLGEVTAAVRALRGPR